MSAFAELRAAFGVNWTTVLVGWKGTGPLSPWPGRQDGPPPMLSADEVTSYGEERLAASSNQVEQGLIVSLLSLVPRSAGRQTVRERLEPLSRLDGGDPEIELRKWRVTLLEQLLRSLPLDPVYGLIALSEFWQSFGFPSDCPHEVQGRGNAVTPEDYYAEDNLLRLLRRHRAWIEREKLAIIGHDRR